MRKRSRFKVSVLAASAVSVLAQAANAQADGAPAVPVQAEPDDEVVIVTARRRAEDVQSVPVAVSAIPLEMIEATGTYNVAQLTQLTPSVQFFSSNPRNTAITIRGLGTSFGLTNDGLESGVGYYIDQVYYSRPAATTFDLLDIGQVEVLRGPQGTLFGKNTTAGAINVAIQAPTFDRLVIAEASVGNYGFLQGKATISGPLIDNLLAFRLSASGTLREGTVYNVTSGKDINNQNNFATRFQLLYRPSLTFSLRLSADYNVQESRCCAQGFVGFGDTLKPAAQEFPALAASLGYAPASLDPFDRLIDTNTLAQANQVLGGASVIADWDFGPATLTSVSAWRTWNWAPANDRDFTSLSVQTKSINPGQSEPVQPGISHHLERRADRRLRRRSLLFPPAHRCDADRRIWRGRHALAPAPIPDTAGKSSRRVCGQRNGALGHQELRGVCAGDVACHRPAARHTGLALHLRRQVRQLRADRLRRPRHHRRHADRAQALDRPAAILCRRLSPTAACRGSSTSPTTSPPTSWAMRRYSKGYKSGGINLAGIPTDAAGNPVITTARIKPEDGTTYELGLKTQFFERTLTANLAVFHHDGERLSGQRGRTPDRERCAAISPISKRSAPGASNSTPRGRRAVSSPATCRPHGPKANTCPSPTVPARWSASARRQPRAI